MHSQPQVLASTDVDAAAARGSQANAAIGNMTTADLQDDVKSYHSTCETADGFLRLNRIDEPPSTWPSLYLALNIVVMRCMQYTSKPVCPSTEEVVHEVVTACVDAGESLMPVVAFAMVSRIQKLCDYNDVFRNLGQISKSP